VCNFLEHLGVDFVSFLFDLIESPPDTDVEEQIPDLFLNLVLAYNLQFAPDVENVMLEALLQRTLAKIFTEKALLLLNREGKKRQQFVSFIPLLNSTPYTKLQIFCNLWSINLHTIFIINSLLCIVYTSIFTV
jgi:hypothetical protein